MNNNTQLQSFRDRNDLKDLLAQRGKERACCECLYITVTQHCHSTDGPGEEAVVPAHLFPQSCSKSSYASLQAQTLTAG